MTRRKEVLVTGGFGQGEGWLGEDDLGFSHIAQLGEQAGVNVSCIKEDGASFAEGRKKVVRADLIVGVVGRPTLEVGMLGRLGESLGKPMVLVYPKGMEVSRLVRGNPNMAAEVICSDENEVEEALKTVFARLKDLRVRGNGREFELLLFQDSPPPALKPPANK